MASAIRDGHRVIAVMLGGTSGRSRDQHVADLLEAAFMEINGAPATALADIRERINFGERGNSSADDLALAQLRRLTPDGEKAPAETALLASLTTSEGADVEDEGSTEEGDDDGVAVAEGEDPGDIQAEGDDDTAADASELAPVAAVAKTIPGSVAALLSAAPGAALAALSPAVEPATQPIAAATPPAPVVAAPVDPAAVAPAPASAPSPLQQ
jgi:hypothetical protein